MISRDLPQIRIEQSNYSLLEFLVQLFTLGIFSVEGGVKAWFELVLITAALCASGYILWWQIPLLIAAIILGTLAAGIFSVLLPQYLEVGNLEADKQITLALQTISEYNLQEISALSGSRLEQRLEKLYKARQILEGNKKIVEQISQLQIVLDNVNQARHIATEKVVIQRETYIREQKEIKERARRQEEAEEKRKREEAEKKKIWITWLNQQRRNQQFTGGCPPDDQCNPPQCRPGYPIKVTLDKKEDGFDGIIWEPSDKKYKSITPKWCYTSVEEAEAESGKYKFRRPKGYA